MPHLSLQGRGQDQRLGPHLEASFLSLKARPQEVGDLLTSYLTGLELLKEEAESAPYTPVVTGNLNSPWGRQPWQTYCHSLYT